MASGSEEKKSSSKPTEQTSKGEFDIDDSQYIDNTNNLLDESPEFSSSFPNNPSLSSVDSINDVTLHSKTLSYNLRTTSRLTTESISLQPTNMTTLQELCHFLGGSHVINKILIANNGIAAAKYMRLIRQWSYEMFQQEKTIKFVVMITPEDRKANAEYIQYADEYVDVVDGPSHMNYLNCEFILEIAKQFCVQAVWTGWNHPLENPKLSELLRQHGIIFIGPSGKTMLILGDKITSTIIAQNVDLPTLLWSGSNLKVEWNEKDLENINIPIDIYEKACVIDAKEGVEIASRIGFPVMIKASKGSGKKGIQTATNHHNFQHYFQQIKKDIPNSPILVMKCVDNCQRLEIQIIADQNGHIISLFNHNYSIQQRHEKSIEETSRILPPPKILEQMKKGAVRLAKLIGYVGVGTIEYLYNSNNETFFFLEINLRLQMEHSFIEMNTNINLPACQIQIGMGIDLHRIKDIRLLYGKDSFGQTSIDFETSHIKSQSSDEGTPVHTSNEYSDKVNIKDEKIKYKSKLYSQSSDSRKFDDTEYEHIILHDETPEIIQNNQQASSETSRKFHLNFYQVLIHDYFPENERKSIRERFNESKQFLANFLSSNQRCVQAWSNIVNGAYERITINSTLLEQTEIFFRPSTMSTRTLEKLISNNVIITIVHPTAKVDPSVLDPNRTKEYATTTQFEKKAAICINPMVFDLDTTSYGSPISAEASKFFLAILLMHEITHAVRYCSPTKKVTPQLPFFRTYADPHKYDAGNALEHELFGGELHINRDSASTHVKLFIIGSNNRYIKLSPSDINDCLTSYSFASFLSLVHRSALKRKHNDGNKNLHMNYFEPFNNEKNEDNQELIPLLNYHTTAVCETEDTSDPDDEYQSLLDYHPEINTSLNQSDVDPLL
ncbi:unnamed protein product [Rotaria sordida]|uniref:Acetyl-CoA carboxylase n=1 Tax=Rotaria sordida TaxID=392033 RepID=A0A819S836_9BILA|nr:unnamed protein product [Rotaria sordida]CAF4048497.1 unnamed protein product [Rotaria sordida]